MEENKENQNKEAAVLAQWSESILNLVNRLVDDIVKVQALKSDLLVLTTKFDHLVIQLSEVKTDIKTIFVRMEQFSTCYTDKVAAEKIHDDIYEELRKMTDRVAAISSSVKDVDSISAAMKDRTKEIEDVKKSVWQKDGKAIIIYGMILAAILQLIFWGIPKLLPMFKSV